MKKDINKISYGYIKDLPKEVRNKFDLGELKENISKFEDFIIGYESEKNMGILDQYLKEEAKTKLKKNE